MITAVDTSVLLSIDLGEPEADGILGQCTGKRAGL